MDKVVECVPNFSEGRRKEVVDAIAGAIYSVEGAKLLDRSMDPDHNRSVITFAGPPDACLEAAFRACKTASELIDMETHKGEHSRIGATDVIPFVPVRGVTMQECAALAKRLGKRIGDELRIPVYLYAEAAACPERRELADVRRGQYEGLKAEMHLPHRKPDFGPAQIGKAGATVVGARPFLVAFNVNLATDDVSIAKEIAKKIREKGGGLRCVRAMGFSLGARGITQVSMNLVDYKVTSPRKVFDAIAREAGERGIKVVESELIGLAPQGAIPPGDEQYLKIANFSREQIIENRV